MVRRATIVNADELAPYAATAALRRRGDHGGRGDRNPDRIGGLDGMT
ncbi:MAG: hypothetical protein QM714_14895 [Nocardioides sp.]